VASAGEFAGATHAPREDVPTSPDEGTLKCDQLLHNTPDVEEIQRTKDLNIESREIRLDRSGPKAKWVAYRGRGTSAEGWRTQAHIDRLDFNPPLQFVVGDSKPEYIAYAVAIAETSEDSELAMSVAENFGPKTGSFQWNGRTYTYTAVKKLPCYEGPEE
jgi:hypothetical protein